jgi:predicted transcriptional regulator
MDALELVRERLAHASLPEMAEVSRVTGVPTHTIYRIVRGLTKSPRHKSLEPLRRYFSERDPE